MPTKVETYCQMADQATEGLTAQVRDWSKFLLMAGQFYKYRFLDQVMIYTQRPTATACAAFDLWNHRMGRRIRRGSKGIALLRYRDGRVFLRYVFDVADTERRENGRDPVLWQYREEYEGAVTAHLEEAFGVPGGDGLAKQLIGLAVQFADDYCHDFTDTIMYAVTGSLLDGLDEDNVALRFCNAVTVSLAFLLLARCGFDLDSYFTPEDFACMGTFDSWASRFGETVTALELAPEGTGYRARTRFARFFNLPELMALFKEVADIKTADQLNLPVPEAEYHTVVCKPTEHQKALVKELSKRAEKVHSGSVDAHIDNMLRITSDGRKLGLDQRIINPALPDEAGTKVNQCVANILRHWRDGEADKLTQLVFSDISTPNGKGFNIYDDIKTKLIAAGMLPEQIAFIHDADSDTKKKELFARVRSGQVRVLIGSTQKMGAGTNIQDRLIASHDLDAPWRPRDLTQRAGRIVRQGNMNEKVHIYRYVTESTFDSYLWQTLEAKQKFISQIMTSRTPLRSCEDVDETALSFAEIKALCAGDPRIKQRMELDVDVSRLRIMKADYQSKKFRLEDDAAKRFPSEIKRAEDIIAGIKADMDTLAANPHPQDGFAGMKVHGRNYLEKDTAGEALLDAVAGVSEIEPVEIGRYRGFTITAQLNAFGEHNVRFQGAVSYSIELGDSAAGNLIRIDNALAKLPEHLKDYQAKLADLHQQMEAAMAEAAKPFAMEAELQQKSARLAELDAALNLGGKGGESTAAA